MSYSNKVLIQGENVLIRYPIKEELKFIRSLWEDEETMKPVGGPIFMNDEAYDRWFNEYVIENSGTFYYLILTKDQEPIGEISYEMIDKEKCIAMFNLKIHAKHRRRGYAIDSMINFLNYVFNQQGLAIMCDEIGNDNFVSQNLFLKFGFKHKKEKSKHVWTEMTRDEFNSLYQDKIYQQS